MSLILPILFILCFFLAIVAIFLSYLVNGALNLWNGIMRTLFGSSPRDGDFGRRRQGRKPHTSTDGSGTAGSPRQDQKIFSADEGTYVDFEEI